MITIIYIVKKRETRKTGGGRGRPTHMHAAQNVIQQLDDDGARSIRELDHAADQQRVAVRG